MRTKILLSFRTSVAYNIFQLLVEQLLLIKYLSFSITRPEY